MEKNVALKYQREAVSTAVYTLNRVQIKKGTHATPFELWYGHSPNVKYLKIFGSRFYILKDNRKGNLDTKSDEGIFLSYSTRSKAYKCLDVNTNKVVESANVKFDELAEVQNVKLKAKIKSMNLSTYSTIPNFEVRNFP